MPPPSSDRSGGFELYLSTSRSIHAVLFYHIHMYGTFADPKPAGSFSYGGTVLNDIRGQLAGPFLNVSLQDPTLPIPLWSMYMRQGADTCGILLFCAD